MKNESREAEIAERLAKATPCLVPNPGKGGISCHEKLDGSWCYCDVVVLLDRNRDLEALAVGLARALDEIRTPACRSENGSAYALRANITANAAITPAVAALLSKAAKEPK